MLLTASLACSPMWDIAAMQMPLGSSLAVSVVSTIRSCIQADAVPAWAHAVRNWSHGLHGSSCAIASHAINFCVHLERAGQSPPPAAVSFFPLPPPSHFPRSAPPLPNPEPPPPLWPPSPPELLMPPAFSLRAPVQHLPRQVMSRPRMATAADGAWDLTFFDANGHCLYRKKRRPPLLPLPSSLQPTSPPFSSPLLYPPPSSPPPSQLPPPRAVDGSNAMQESARRALNRPVLCLCAPAQCTGRGPRVAWQRARTIALSRRFISDRVVFSNRAACSLHRAAWMAQMQCR